MESAQGFPLVGSDALAAVFDKQCAHLHTFSIAFNSLHPHLFTLLHLLWAKCILGINAQHIGLRLCVFFISFFFLMRYINEAGDYWVFFRALTKVGEKQNNVTLKKKKKRPDIKRLHSRSWGPAERNVKFWIPEFVFFFFHVRATVCFECRAKETAEWLPGAWFMPSKQLSANTSVSTTTFSKDFRFHSVFSRFFCRHFRKKKHKNQWKQLIRVEKAGKVWLAPPTQIGYWANFSRCLCT